MEAMPQTSDNNQVDCIIAAHLLACEAGNGVDVDTLCDAHRHFEREIRQYFTDSERLATAVLEPSNDSPVRIDGYEILQPLGRGGMGVVFAARQVSLNRNVAIKVLRDGVLSSAAVRNRFAKEAQLIARMKHDNIVDVIEYGHVGNRAFMVMPLLEGQPLSRVIREQPLSEKPAAMAMIRVADAIQHAHDHGVIHRDIKPGNIIGDCRNCQVTDFGLATLKESDDRLTGTHEIVGTAGYLAAEIIRGESRGEITTDVYALGATLYALLIGQPPHRAATVMESMLLATTSDPVEPKDLNPTLSTDVNSITMKCLNYNPARRYQSVTDFRQDVQRLLDGRPVSARPLSTFGRIARWCLRHRAATAAIAASALLATVLLAGLPLVLLLNHQKQQAEELADANAGRAATQQYYARVAEISDWQRERQPGWSWRSLEALREVAELPADGRDPFQLRSMIAEAAVGIDAKVAATFGAGKPIRQVFVSPSERHVAVIRGHGTMSCYGLDSADQKVKAKLIRYFGNPDDSSGKNTVDWLLSQARQLNGGYKFLSAGFSHDGQFLAGGTGGGDVFEWELADNSKPGRALTSANVGAQWLRIQYTPDDKFLVGIQYPEGNLYCVDREANEIAFTDSRVSTIVTRSGASFASTPNGLAVVPSDLVSELQLLPRGADVVRHIAVSDSGEAVFGLQKGNTAGVVDAATGHLGLPFQYMPRQTDRSFPSIHVGPANATAMLRIESSVVRIYDALNGQPVLAIRFPDSDRVQPKVLLRAGMIAANSASHVTLHQLRTPRSFREHSSATRDCFVRVYAPSSWRIISFDIDHANQRLAILEQDGEIYERRDPRKVDVFPRRVRVVDLLTMKEISRCTISSLSSNTNTHKTYGGDVALAANGDTLVASRTPGFLFRLNDDGIQPLPGQQVSVLACEPQLTADAVRYSMRVPRLSGKQGVHVLTLAVRSKNVKAGTRIVGRGISQKTSWDTDLGATLADSDNGQWQCVQVCLQQAGQLSSDGAFTIEGCQNAALTVTTDSTEFHGATSAIQFGPLFISAGNAQGEIDYGLGPMGVLGSGDVFSIDDEQRAKKWDDTTQQPQLHWVDLINVSHKLTAIATGETMALVATTPGQVLKVTASNDVTQITPGPRFNRSRPSGDTTTSLAISANDYVGLAGNRNGELLLFDLTKDSDWQVERKQHHADHVTAVACSRNGNWIASAGKTGELRLYRRDQNQLQPFFEIAALDQPVEKMMFSPNADWLYFLCRNERGLRVLDLKKLFSEFDGM